MEWSFLDCGYVYLVTRSYYRAEILFIKTSCWILSWAEILTLYIVSMTYETVQNNQDFDQRHGFERVWSPNMPDQPMSG